MSKVVETYAVDASTSVLTSLACEYSMQLKHLGIVGLEVSDSDHSEVLDKVTYDIRYFKEYVNVYGITNIEVRKDTDMYKRVMVPLVGDR